MTDLIPIARRDGIETVNARDLHAFLEVGDHFATWIKDRVGTYSFAENIDFTSYSEPSEKGRPRVEYALTLDMAKELAMVERNERGKQARAYFIECERRARAAVETGMKPLNDALTLAALNDPSTLRTLLLANTEKVLSLEAAAVKLEAQVKEEQARADHEHAKAVEQTAKVEAQKPKVEALDRIATSDGSLCITDAAKTLQVRPNILFNYLREHRWIYKRVGTVENVGYQDKIQSGVLEHKTKTVTRADGSEKTITQVRVTPKGLTRLAADLGSDDSQAAFPL